MVTTMITGISVILVLSSAPVAVGLSVPSIKADLNPPVVRMRLDNSDDMQYVGDMKVGHQNLRGIFDTGSFELLVFSSACQLCGEQHLLYNHSISGNYSFGNLSKMHSFGSGDTWSHEAADVVNVGPLSAYGQPFWEVVDTAMPVLQNAAFQAIVGLGPLGSAQEFAQQQANDATAAKMEFIQAGKAVPPNVLDDERDALAVAEHTDGVPGLVQNLGVRSFSVCVGQGLGDPGVLVWNDNEFAKSPNLFTRIPVAGSVHWSVELTDARIGHGNYGDGEVRDVGCGGEAGTCGAVLDTGTSLIAAPRKAIDQVEQALARLGGDCSKIDQLPDLQFNLGGQPFSLPPESYIGQIVGDVPQQLAEMLQFKSRQLNSTVGAFCQPLLMTINATTQFGPMWILGIPFFRRYYTTFHSVPIGAKRGPHGRLRKKAGVFNSILAAVADDNCNPTAQTSFMLKPRDRPLRRRSMMKVNPKSLRIPTWLGHHVGKHGKYKV